MTIGPLEYLVIGVKTDPFMETVLPQLHSLEESGLIRIMDLLFVGKDADGAVTVMDIRDVTDAEHAGIENQEEDVLMGLFTAADIDRLAEDIPANATAAIVLLEHVWAIGVTEAVRKAGGVVFTGGMITPEAVQAVSAELTAQEVAHA